MATKIKGTGIATGAIDSTQLANLSGHFDLLDSNNIRLGNSQDLKLYHHADHSYIENNTGTLFIDAAQINLLDGSNNAATFTAAGATTLFNAGNAKLATTSTGVLVTGHITASGTNNIYVGDNGKFIAGASDDLQIYHTGTNSYIDDAGTGALNIRSSALFLEKQDGSEVMASFLADGAATFYHNGSPKLATSSSGITVTGSISGATATASGGTNTTALASTAFVQQEITSLIGGAPGALDTLNELAAAINDDSNYNSTLTTALATKLPLAGGTMTGALNMGSNNITTTGKMLYANVYSATGDLPSASTYHGMFAHVHGTGKGYFAHAGNWIELANQSDVNAKAPLANPDFTGQIQASNTASTIHELITTNNNTRSTLNLQSKDSSGNLVSLRMHALGDGPRAEIFTYTNHNLAFATNNAAPQMTLDTGGRLGIGQATLVNNFALQVTGLGGASGDARAVYLKGSGAHTSIGGTGPTLVLQNTNSTTNNIVKLSFESASSGETVSINAINTNHSSHYGDMAFNTRGSGGYSEKMRIMANGNVGIGITNPTHKLQVLSTDNKGFYLERNTGNEPANLNEFSSYYSLSIKNRAGGSFLNFGGGGSFSSIQATDGAGSATAKDILLNPYGGQVGIGTTPTAWASGYKSLQIGNRGFVGAHSGSDLYVGQNAYFNSGWKYEAAVAASMTQHSGGQITHFIAATGSAGGDAITWTPALHIKAGGYVGIGTNAPNRHLVLYGTASSTTSIQFQNADTGLASGDGFGVGLDSTEKGFIWNYEGNDTYIGGAGGKSITIKNDGKVGIAGDTTAPNFLLHINKGSSSFAPTNGVNQNIFGLNTSYNSTGSQGVSFSRLDGNWIDGTSGADSAYGWVWHYENQVRGGIVYDHRGSERMQMWSSYGALGFMTANSGDTDSVPTDSNQVERITILTGGNVGVGTTNPSQKLHVAGNTLIEAQELTIQGGGANYSNGALVFKATNGTSVRGLGVYMHDAGGDHEWYAGTPYNGSDQYQIGRKTGSAHASDANQHAYAFMTVKNNGRVGIGTINPNLKLHVEENTDTWVGEFKNVRSAGGYGLRIDNSGAGGATDTRYALGVYTPGNSGFFVRNNGTVGMGTAAPAKPLHLKVTSGWATARLEGAGDSGGEIEFYAGSTKKASMWVDNASSDLNFKAGGVYTTAKFQADGNWVGPHEDANKRNFVGRGPFNVFDFSDNWHELHNPASTLETPISTMTNAMGVTMTFPANTTKKILQHERTPTGTVGVIYEAVPDSASTWNGGWNSGAFSVDPDKGYLFGYYARRITSASAGTHYAGFQRGVQAGTGSTEDSNPYFTSFGNGGLPQGVWCLIYMHLHPRYYTGTGDGGISGVYRCDNGSRIYGQTAWKMPTGQTTQTFRSYNYYSGNTSVAIQWYAPFVYEINGHEPTVNSLLPKP